MSGYAAWNQYDAYAVGDVVNYAGFNYMAAVPNQGVPPFPATPDWTLIIPPAPPAVTPTLSQVLTAGNDTTGQNIIGSSSTIFTNILEANSLRALGAPVATTVALEANLDAQNISNLENIRQISFNATAGTPTHYSINGVYNIDSGALPFPVARFSAAKAGGTQQKSLTLDMTDGEAIWSSQWEGYVPDNIRTKQNVYTIDGQGTGARTDIKCDTVNITPNFLPAATVNITGGMNVDAANTQVKIYSTSTDSADLRLEGQGSKGGNWTVDEGNGLMLLQAGGGLNFTMEADGGNINIPTTTPDTTARMSVNGATAEMVCEDVAGVGNVALSANTITVSNPVSGSNPTIVLNVPSITSPTISGFDNAGNPNVDVLANQLRTWTGAIEGVEIGNDFTQNYVRGMGLPFRIAHGQGTETTDFITMDGTGITGVQATNLVSIVAAALTGAVGIVTAAGETVVDMVADGTGNGKVDIKAEAVGASPRTDFRILMDGATGRDIRMEGVLFPTESIRDTSSSLGAPGQFLSAGASGQSVKWETVPTVWGAWSRLDQQTISAANTTYFATYDTQDVAPTNCSCPYSTGGSPEITIDISCSKIRICSSILANTNSPSTYFRFWLVKNGVNVQNTGSIVLIKDSGTIQLLTCEWVDTCNAGDIYKVAVQANNSSAVLYYDMASGTSPNDFPASPSIITTVCGYV